MVISWGITLFLAICSHASSYHCVYCLYFHGAAVYSGLSPHFTHIILHVCLISMVLLSIYHITLYISRVTSLISACISIAAVYGTFLGHISYIAVYLGALPCTYLESHLLYCCLLVFPWCCCLFRGITLHF